MRFVLTLITFSLLTCLRTLDILTTFRFDPFLSREGNPAVFFFGGGKSALVATTGVSYAVSLFFLFLFCRSEHLRLSSRPPNVRAFLRIWVKRVVRARPPIRQSLPGGTHWNEGLQAMRLLGLALPWALIFGSVTAIHAWLGIEDRGVVTAYQRLYSTLRIGGVNYLIWLTALPGFVVGSFLFFWTEYRHISDKF